MLQPTIPYILHPYPLKNLRILLLVFVEFSLHVIFFIMTLFLVLLAVLFYNLHS